MHFMFTFIMWLGPNLRGASLILHMKVSLFVMKSSTQLAGKAVNCPPWLWMSVNTYEKTWGFHGWSLEIKYNLPIREVI